MPANDPELQLQASLDNQLVIQSLEEINESARKMVQSGDAEMRKLGESVLGMAGRIEQGRDAIDLLGETFIRGFTQGKVKIGELRELVNQLAADTKSAAKGAKEDLAGYTEIQTPEGIKGISNEWIHKFIDTQLIESKFVEVEQIARQMMNSVSADAKNTGEILLAAMTQIRESGKPIEEVEKDINNLLGTTKKLAKEADAAFDEDVFGELDTSQAEAEFERLQETIAKLKNSANADVNAVGVKVEEAGNKIKGALDRGEISATKATKSFQRLGTTGKKIGTILGEDMRDKVDRAQASIWKMSIALDRVGIRGLGGVLRVADAIKGIHPAAVLAVAGIVGITLAIKKLTEAIVAMAKKAGEAFLKLAKDSIELAKSYEAVELQIRNLFKGNEQLARETLNRIMELGAELGVDLSGRLSQVFLPLVENFEQFERLAQSAATLAVKTGKDMDEVSRALQQAVAGQFRALQYQFGLTADQIDNIKEKQEELGATAGLIEGMEEYFEATGTGWDTFEDSLRRVQGQLTETFNLFKFQLGEPIKIALTEQLTGLRDWFSENEDAVKGFFRDIGEAIADVINVIGDFGNALVDNIDEEWLDEVSTQFQILAASIEQAFGRDQQANAEGMLGIISFVADAASKLVIALRVAWNLFGGLSALALSVIPGSGIPTAGVIDKLLTDLNNVYDDYKELQTLEDQILQDKAEERARGEDIEGNLDEQIDSNLELNALTARRAELMDVLAEKEAELKDKIASIMTDMQRALRDIDVELGRRRVDISLDSSRRREDLYRKHQDSLRDIATKSGIRLRDLAIDDIDKREDIEKKHARKMIEIDLDEAKKKEDLEEKHQDRLRQIRDKFAFDAREAIRANDAVAFFRLKRRLEFELNQENQKNEDSIEDATEAAEDKREELARQLEYEEEDLAESNRRKLRDIKLKLNDELKAERQKYKDSLEEANIAEERRLEDLQIWYDQELQDWNQTLDDKLEDLRDANADAIEEYENTLDEVKRINQRIAANMFQGMASFLSALPGANLFGQFLPGIGGQLFTGGIGSYAPPGGYAGIANAPGANVGFGGGIPGQTNESQLSNLAVDLAKQLFTGRQLTQILGVIEDATVAELQQYILAWQNTLNRGGHGAQPPTASSFQHGGIRNAGVLSRVGERGPELEIPAQHGIIAPHAPFMMPSQAQPNIQSTVDNSRNISASIDLLDPTHVSEVQKTLWRSFVTEQLLAIEGGG